MLAQARAKKEELERAARAKKEELERQVRLRKEQLETGARAQLGEAKAKAGLDNGAADRNAAVVAEAAAGSTAAGMEQDEGAAAEVGAGLMTAAEQQATPPVPPAAAASAAVGPVAATPAATETQRLTQPESQPSNRVAIKASPPMPMTAAVAVGSAVATPAAAETQSPARPDPQLSNLIAVKAKSVPTWVIALWFGYVLHTAIMYFVVAPIINSIMGEDGNNGEDDNNGDEVTLMTLLVTIGPAVHVIMIPVFCALAKHYEQSENKRRAELIKEVQREGRHVSIEDMRDAGGQTIFFSAKLTLKEKIITGVLGTIIDIVSLILSFVPTDLSNFWFPEPFYLFWRAKLQTRHYRILGAELRLNASMADGYFLWCYEALFNFYTFKLYGMCYAKAKGLNYNRWLDQRLDWVGLAPAGTTDEFVVFNEKLPLDQMVQVKLLTCCCGWVPCITVPVHWYTYKLRVSNKNFGGITPTFGNGYTIRNMFLEYIKTFFWGLHCDCSGKEKEWIDSHIVIMPINAISDDLESNGGASAAEKVAAFRGSIEGAFIPMISAASDP